MSGAFDYSYARPTGQEMVDSGGPNALAYTGSGKPRPTYDYIQSLLADGCTFTFIQESYPTRAQEGYGAGVADAQYADAQADGVGYPNDTAIVYCASDGNRWNPGGEVAASIAEYGRGVASVTRRPVLVYGNRMAVDAFRLGAGAKCVGTWVPSTWDARTDVDVLVQEANVSSPVDGTDYNTAYGEWPRWGAAPVPQPEPKKEEDMECIVIAGADGRVHAYRFQGTTQLDEFGGAPDPVYGIPQDALASGLRITRLDDKKPADNGPGTAWDRLLTASNNAQGNTTTVPADPSTLTDAELMAELGKRLLVEK